MSVQKKITIDKFIRSMEDVSKKKTSSYNSTAVVTRIDRDSGIAWVHIPGGEDETPVELTMNAKAGENVKVSVGKGRAFLVGNASSPPTDDRRANQAYDVGIEAKVGAEKALFYAEEAKESAAVAKKAADDATTDAKRAQEQADDATESALSANRSANTALRELSTVEDVVDVINWIAQHGRYALTYDPYTVDGKTYFTVTGTAVTEPLNNKIQFYYERSGSGTSQSPYVYTLTTDETVASGKTYYTIVSSIVPDESLFVYQQVQNPEGNPSENGWYELSSGNYVLSQDTVVVSGKTYYEKVSANPSELGWYQLLDVDEAVRAYIYDHVALSDEGLSLVANNRDDRTLITNGYYRKTEDSTVQSGKDYYVLVNGTYSYVQNPVTSDIGTYYELFYKPGTHIFVGGEEVAYYGTDTRIGKDGADDFNLKITNETLSFCKGKDAIAYLSGDRLYINQSVVVSEMQVGEHNGSSEWTWKYDKSDRSLYLKWIGE